MFCTPLVKLSSDHKGATIVAPPARTASVFQGRVDNAFLRLQVHHWRWPLGPEWSPPARSLTPAAVRGGLDDASVAAYLGYLHQAARAPATAALVVAAAVARRRNPHPHLFRRATSLPARYPPQVAYGKRVVVVVQRMVIGPRPGRAAPDRSAASSPSPTAVADALQRLGMWREAEPPTGQGMGA